MPFRSTLEVIVQPKCKICQSPYRVEIEKRLVDGDKPLPVARWLLEAHGVKIADVSIYRHLNKHMPMREEVKKQLAIARQSRKMLVSETAKVLAEIEGLDEVFMYAREIAIAKKELVKAGSATMIDALCLKWMLVEMREAVRIKHELSNGKKVNLVQDGLLGFLKEGAADDDEDDR